MLAITTNLFLPVAGVYVSHQAEREQHTCHMQNDLFDFTDCSKPCPPHKWTLNQHTENSPQFVEILCITFGRNMTFMLIHE